MRFNLRACVLSVLLLSPWGWTALATHLDIIEYDLVQADARFSGLSGVGQTVAVLDTGIDTQHVLLSPRVVGGVNEAGDLPDALPAHADYHGHGTIVSSVAAGSGATITTGPSAGTEIGGIARGADIVSVRVLDRTGSGSFFDVLDGLNWVLANRATFNITVVNMSLGTEQAFLDPQVLIDNVPLASDINDAVLALNAAGVTVVASAGNAGQPGASFPAVLPPVISVGSTDDADALSSFSNRSDMMDMVAPGEDVWGAFFDNTQPTVHNLAAQGTGTSFSSPEVAGAVLLIRELYIERAGTPPHAAWIEQILKETGVAVPFDTGSEVLTFPRLDLYAALEATYAIPEPASATLVLIGASVLIRRKAA